MELKTYFAQDRSGNLIPSASVAIYLAGTNTLATGLKNVSGANLSNPFTADADGKIQFYAPDGIYDMQVSLGIVSGVKVTFQCLDVQQQLSSAESAAERAEAAASSVTGINANFEVNTRENWRRTLAEAGLTLVDGSFEDGATAQGTTDAVWHIAGGQCYTWGGAFPKTVEAESTPGSTGGIDAAAWSSVADVLLRGNVKASMVGKEGGGTVQEFISTEDYQRTGDIRGYGAVWPDVTPVNAVVAAGNGPGIMKIAKGTWNGNFALKNKTGLRGESITSTSLIVPQNVTGIKPEGDDVRGMVISDLALQVDGAVTGGAPIGTGVGLDLSFCSKVVNCVFSNLYLDFFDIGYNAGPADFSNVYNNVRANNNRIGFNLVSNGTIIQNVFNGCYAANWTAYGLRISGASNQVFNAMNFGHSGAANAYFVHIDTNSRGIIFNAPNFEMDGPGGKLTAGGQAIMIASDSEVTFNSPVFNKLNASGTGMYLVRVRGSAVVRINDPEVYNDDGTAGHLHISENAVVYLNDPKGNFKVITVAGNGRLIRVHEKVNNAPNYTALLSLKSGDVVNFGFYAKYAMAVPDFHAATMPATFKYAVSFDSYSSANGTAVARVYDTTTGLGISNVSVPVFVQAWREDK